MGKFLGSLLLSILAFSTLGSTVYAQDFAGNLKAADTALKNADSRLKDAKEKHQSSIEKYNQGISDRNTSLFNRVRSFFKLTAGKGEYSGSPAIVPDYSESESTKTKLDQDREYLTKLKAELGAAKSDLDSAGKELLEAQKKADTLKKQQDVLERVLQKASLSDKFSELKSEIQDTNYILDKVSMQLDQQLIGVYLQDKMHQLLNSNALCSAVNQCEAGKRKNSATDIKFSQMTEIFGNSPAPIRELNRTRAGAK